MSAKRFPVGLEVHDMGTRRLYVKTSSGFVLHSDDLTPDELVLIAKDISVHNDDLTETERMDTGQNRQLGLFHEFSF